VEGGTDLKGRRQALLTADDDIPFDKYRIFFVGLQPELAQHLKAKKKYFYFKNII